MRRHAPFSKLTPALVLAAGLVLATTGLASDSPFTKHRHICAKSFERPAKADEEKLIECADLYSTYARFHIINGGYRSAAKKAMRWMYENGSNDAAAVARDGLFRYGIKLPVRTARKDRPVRATRKRRKRYDPPEATKSDKRAAEKVAKDGVKDLVRKKVSRGVGKLKKAIGLDPRSEYAIYNIGCGYSLQKKRNDAIQWLQNLADLGTEQSAERLIRARSDGDFTYLRQDADFKRITGYAKIMVINHIGEPGEPAIENIETLLGKLGHKDVQTDTSKKKRDSPQVLFKPSAKAQVALIAELLNHPRVRIDPIKGRSKYDLIIRWGARVKKKGGSVKVESMGPDTVDGKMAKAKRRQNKILAKPDKAINKVDRVISTPERTYKSAESMGKRVEGSYKKGEGLFKKVKGMGDKINSL
ncbi:MAG: hypothetical protein KC502_21085 [Myxococcales bacterium]|nr:hypothetical protein [Myxococcales bacterium]